MLYLFYISSSPKYSKLLVCFQSQPFTYSEDFMEVKSGDVILSVWLLSLNIVYSYIMYEFSFVFDNQIIFNQTQMECSSIHLLMNILIYFQFFLLNKKVLHVAWVVTLPHLVLFSREVLHESRLIPLSLLSTYMLILRVCIQGVQNNIQHLKYSCWNQYRKNKPAIATSFR